MAGIVRRTKRYLSDLTDEGWEQIAPVMAKRSQRGRKPAMHLREILSAIRYTVRSVGSWRMLPSESGQWQTVYWCFRRFVHGPLFRTIHNVMLMLDHERAGREASPSGGVMNSQSIKAPFAVARGYDGGKKVVGHKRHIVIDTDGGLLMDNLTMADLSNSAGAQLILDDIRKRSPRLKHLFADGAYDRTQLIDKAAFLDFVIEIVRRSDQQPGIAVIQQQWIVERTFGWMIHWRQLVRDDEKRRDVFEAMIHVAMGSLLLRRIAHP